MSDNLSSTWPEIGLWRQCGSKECCLPANRGDHMQRRQNREARERAVSKAEVALVAVVLLGLAVALYSLRGTFL